MLSASVPNNLPRGAGQQGSVYHPLRPQATSSQVCAPSVLSRRAYRNGWGNAALVMAVIGAWTAWVPLLGFIFPVLAVCFSSAGLARVRTGRANNRGITIAGAVLGLLALIGAAVFLVLFITEVVQGAYGRFPA